MTYVAMKRNAITTALFVAGLTVTTMAQAGIFVQESKPAGTHQAPSQAGETSAKKFDPSSMPKVTTDSTRLDGLWWKEGGAVQLWAIGVEPSQNFPVYSGMGSNLPLKHALSMIVPSDWTVSVDSAVNQDQIVSWSIDPSDEKTWLDALADVMKASGAAADVRRFGQRVTILPHIPDSRMAEEVEGWQRPESTTTAAYDPVTAPVRTAAIGPREFKAGNVETTFEAFLAGWDRKLHWKTKLDNALVTRFAIPLSGSSFENDLNVILNALNEGDFRIEADEYQNGIVVISVER